MEATEFEIAISKTAAPIATQPPKYDLVDALKEAGATIPHGALPRVLEAIENALDTHGDQRAAEALRIILERLGGGRRGEELKAALLGAVEGDGPAMASRFGTSKQNWYQRVGRLRKSLGLPSF